jgi:RNA:NAD 2'-phosphotransferase (TPT1/KptA family)/8-oxo-dGTP pyrophosphatase MutT (NUDIX family)
VSVPELDRIASALGRLLRSDKVARRDADGFVPFEVLALLLASEVGVAIDPGVVRRVAERGRRFEVLGECVRAVQKAPAAAPVAPDILYHACTAEQVRRYRQEGAVRTANNKPVFLSDDEGQAWRAAHRMGGEPRVLYVDTMRQRRRRLRVQRNRRGLYLVKAIPLADVLNLQPQFAEQRSAGGIPVMIGEDGKPRMALIRVTRRSGATWEVAKGKLEPGEPPEWAGIREVQEEMGVSVDFDVRTLIGLIRYGFLAPGGLPRLKTVYLYLLDPRGDMGGRFKPAAGEGVRDVRWFTPEEACRVVSHSSLRPLMQRARELVEEGARNSAPPNDGLLVMAGKG